MTSLYAVDQQQTIFNGNRRYQPLQPLRYAPYGHCSPRPELLGFNGEQPNAITGHYLLGNGYRAFNPTTMRFNSPDFMAPFGRGGLNVYAYCHGDPINLQDPSGHSAISRFFLRARNWLTGKKSGPEAYKVKNITTQETISVVNTEPRPRREANLDDYVHIGFHGSSVDFISSLEAGVTTRDHRGYGLKGFFVTTSFSTANAYAKHFGPQSGHVFNVYLKKGSSLRCYSDYLSYEGASFMVAFQEPVYDRLLVRAHTPSSPVRRVSFDDFNIIRRIRNFPQGR